LRSTNKKIKNEKENATIRKENDTIRKENDKIRKENDTIGKENDTIRKENWHTTYETCKGKRHGLLIIIASFSFL